MTIHRAWKPIGPFLPLFASFVCGAVLGIMSLKLKDRCRKTNQTSLLHEENEATQCEQDVVSQRLDIPENAPDHCPGVESRSAACAGCPNQTICASGEGVAEDPSAAEIRDKMAIIKKKVLILSGKGGVGKSTVSSQLSWLLESRHFHVGLLDIDVCGPSIPILTGSRGQDVHASADGWSPIYVRDNLAVMSIGFLLPDEDDAVIWRGPKKNGLIKQFLTDVHWKPLDILLVDTPPGTSDEHLSIVTYLKSAVIDGAMIVTTPQQVALQDVRKEINFCKKVGVPILGVIENMSHSMFDDVCVGAVKEMCIKMDVPYAGSVPMDRDLLLASEKGCCVSDINKDSSSYLELNHIVDGMLATLHMPSQQIQTTDNDAIINGAGIYEAVP